MWRTLFVCTCQPRCVHAGCVVSAGGRSGKRQGGRPNPPAHLAIQRNSLSETAVGSRPVNPCHNDQARPDAFPSHTRRPPRTPSCVRVARFHPSADSFRRPSLRVAFSPSGRKLKNKGLRSVCRSLASPLLKEFCYARSPRDTAVKVPPFTSSPLRRLSLPKVRRPTGAGGEGRGSVW